MIDLDKGKTLRVEEELDEPRTWCRDITPVIGELDERGQTTQLDSLDGSGGERSDSGTMPRDRQTGISVLRMETDMGTPTLEIYKSFRGKVISGQGQIVRHPIFDEKWGKEQGKVKEKRKQAEEEGRSRKRGKEQQNRLHAIVVDRLVIPEDITPSFMEKVELKCLRYNNNKLDLKLSKNR
ncbi:hypothetical protein ACLOJK_036687 [Asimina triloba]